MPDSTVPTAPPKLTHPVPIPQDAAVYSALSTDHYPWTEVTADLALRQGQGFTGAFDAWQGARWARFLWHQGTLLGGYTHAGQAVNWATVMQGLPRARVSLTELSARMVDLLWTTRDVDGRPAPAAWPAARPVLEAQHYHGLMLSGAACSYWLAGRHVSGDLPAEGTGAWLFAPNSEANRAGLLRFWQDLLAATHRAHPLDATWQEVTVRLAEQHPCLDPFAQDVTLQGGHLSVQDDVPVDEFRPALSAALRGVLARLGVRLVDLPITNLRDRPEWAAAGLETP
ncbi:hypothetical protein GCM10008956_20900 [Deinococcus arenae]|uniref:Uncharacterized protein n=1 Tax=Deinococcus arenae TaxID=1452751 RepID=A0A8H9GPN2_9DEIO|nr:hypothetical protein [Deinococcus arenae]AWT35132.1 hypothetical protein DM785_05880 [Deinococcus actinosclerus]GGM44437.1 hypothetical protein GCM10008956_20900 [Deinococcus arenae]